MKNPTTQTQGTPSWDQLHAMILATSEQMKATNRRIQEIYEQTERQMRDTDKKMKELQGLFTTQWGKLVEALCRPAALKFDEDSDIYALKRGLYVMRATGEGIFSLTEPRRREAF